MTDHHNEIQSTFNTYVYFSGGVEIDSTQATGPTKGFSLQMGVHHRMAAEMPSLFSDEPEQFGTGFGTELGYKRLVGTDTDSVSNRLFWGTAQNGSVLQVPVGIYGQWGHENEQNTGGGGINLGLALCTPISRTEDRVPAVQLIGELRGQAGLEVKEGSGLEPDFGIMAGVRVSLGAAVTWIEM